MHPLLQQFLTSLIRHVLTLAGGWLLARGWLEPGMDVPVYAAGFATLLVGLAWSWWQKYHAHVLFRLAHLADPSTPEREIRALAQRTPPGLVLGLLLAGALAGSLGCATGAALTRRTAYATEQVGAGLVRAQTAVMELHTRGVLSDGDYRAAQRTFLQAGLSIKAINAALREGDQAGAVGQIQAVVDLIDTLIREDVIRLPAADRDRVAILLETTRAVLISLSVALGE